MSFCLNGLWLRMTAVAIKRIQINPKENQPKEYCHVTNAKVAPVTAVQVMRRVFKYEQTNVAAKKVPNRIRKFIVVLHNCSTIRYSMLSHS